MQEVARVFVLALWDTLREMSPFLIFGFFIAGVLSVFIQPETVERHLGGSGFKQVIKAALFGVPLPLCSCGVIPVGASLRRHGAGAGATTSFLISTPQTGVDSIMVTLSLLGPVFAVFRPIVSFVSGVIGGALVNTFGEERDASPAGRPVCVGECCTGAPGQNSFIRALRYGFVTLPKDINKALVVGVLIAGLIAAIVPDDYFSTILGGGILAMIVMMLVGIPIYVCATASVPIAAALIMKGVSPGAALVFLMTGPATNAATVSTIWKTMGKRTAGLYLGTVAGAALLAGLLLDSIISGGAATSMHGMPWMIPQAAKTIAAVVLLGVLAAAFFQPTRVGDVASAKESETDVTISIEGMSCDHCARSIRRAILESAGVTAAEVDFKKGKAVVTGAEFDVDELKKAIESLGYTVSGVSGAGVGAADENSRR
jgi:uncharacterized membrane protein YraQ (UPF0718 family)/copper chaperone CopZ